MYQEEFYNQGTWTKGNDDIRELKVNNGKYYFQHKKNEGSRHITTRSFTIDFNRNFEIETSILKVSGVQDYGMSFLFDYKDSNNYTEFGITSTGYYRVAETNSGTYRNIKSWTSSSSVKKGNYATNKLTIKKIGNRITFYVNNAYMYGMDFKSFKGNKLGFLLYKNQKVAIDYFRVKYTDVATTNTVTKNTNSKTILFEGFNNNDNQWSISNTENVRLAIENGNYNINHKRETGGWATTIKKYINTSRDYRITAQIKKSSGIQNNGYGITFGKKDNNNLNNFLVSGDGSFKVVKFDNGTKTTVKNWTKSSKIKTGNGVYNYLKIEKQGTAYKFFINSNLVHTSYSIKSYGDSMGFILYDRQAISVGYVNLAYIDSKGSTTIKKSTNSHVSKETIIFDGFTDNKNNWSTTKNQNIELDVKNGNYYINHKREKGGWSSTSKKYINTSRDFKILADIKKESGILNNGYGIVFGRKDSDNQNLFFINGNGSYSINKLKNGKNNYLKNWVASNSIRKGNGGYNVLKVVKVGSKLEYYINNVKVYTDYNPEFFGDRLGFIVYDRQKISVAYLSVGYLDKKSTVNYNKTNIDNIENYSYNNNGFQFSEQFINTNNPWFIGSDEKKDFKIKDGKYYLNHKRDEKGWATYLNNDIDTSKDFEIETKIDKISGKTNYGYGLIFGKKGSSDFRFYISSNGYYKVSRMIDNNEEVIQKWVTSSYVNTGNLKSNTLKVKKENGYYKFYINGSYVYQMEFENFFGNDLGYVVYNNQEIAVDYVRVKYLNQNKTVVRNNKILNLPLKENFLSNNNGWATDNVENYSSKVNNGKLTIHRKKEGGIFISKDVNINTNKDFIIETSISREKSGATGLYGLTFGRKNSSNEYTFLISTNGSYMFRKFDNNNYVKIIPFTPNKAVKTGISQKNKLKIVKSGKLLRFYINDKYLNEATFQEFYGNKIGFTAYHEQKIAVDYLNIKYQTDSYNNPPLVVISEPDVDVKRGFKIVKTKKIKVRGKATDKDGIYEVLINGIDAQVFEDGSFVANVPLKIGSNDLVVKATDIKQASSTKTFRIKRKSPQVDIVNPNINPNVNPVAKLDIGFGKYYALLIGVSDYNDASNVPDLEGLPTKDAQDLKNVLVNKYNFENENVIMLNNSPTENQILREFVKLKKKITNKDNVLIFYAGHGIYDEATETGSWLPSDADPEYGLNMISNSTIKDYIKGINSKHTLLISDACFSGSIFKTRSYKNAPKSITRKFELPSRKAITSGTLKTVPNKSVFLKYLIDRLNKNTSPYLTARKIFDNIEEPVMNNSKNVPQYGTIQEVGDEGGDFIFIRRN
ncbi:hypothetical protein BTO18_04335 [Polaribacter porphyrae]|uniref:Caspase family p20 domain-containing protein n=1 Tax=Polaribacter porphyrae TaxID=1137780 RepID=A0A2S7WLH4_9FLAO|nr:hypothetical protein BTO18_04335 [Polaribacter porphyrae]